MVPEIRTTLQRKARGLKISHHGKKKRGVTRSLPSSFLNQIEDVYSENSSNDVRIKQLRIYHEIKRTSLKEM